MRNLALLLCTALLVACAHDATRSADDMGHTSRLPTANLPAGIFPASQAVLPTTAGRIFLANLDARIDALLEAGAAEPGSPAAATLATTLYYRFQVLGSIDDAERALALMERIEDPGAAELRARAALRSGLHRFDAALGDLARAEELDRARPSDARSRRTIAFATGNYDQVRELIDNAARPSAEFGELVLRGNVAVYKDDLPNASVQFLRAQQTIHDTDPYALAWLYAQQGIALLRFDRCEDAMPFFLAAETRIPGFALAMDHRAECLLRKHRLDQARTLYSKLIEQTGNPIFMGGLALVEAEAGNQQLAQELKNQTQAAWNALLARQPKAWSEHAAEYFLATGQEDEALRLAELNLANRRDVLSLILMARAARANGEQDRACQALDAVRGSGLKPPELRHYATELPDCENVATMGIGSAQRTIEPHPVSTVR